MKTKIITILLLLGVGSWLQKAYFGHIQLSQDVLTNLITFLSILFGFYITSLAIFVTSKYVRFLYQVVDAKEKSQTLLNTLLNNYRLGLNLALFSLSYFMALSFFISKEGRIIHLDNYLTLPLISLFIINIFYSYKMLNDLIQIILQEAKDN
jgi:hypothetical protein